MMMSRAAGLRLRAVAGLGLVGLLLAACSSSGSGSSGGGQSASPGSSASGGHAADSSLSTIQIGLIADVTGIQSSAAQGAITAAPAWAQWVNSEMGGIGGHPVQVNVVDDKEDPATGLADAKDLVEGKHVIAIVGEVSATTAAWADYMLQKRVPVVGGTANYPPYWTNPMFFPLAVNGVTANFTVGDLAKKAGAHKAGMVYCAEVAQCQALTTLVKPGLARNNIQFVGGYAISATAPNYTPQCLQLHSAVADLVEVATSVQPFERMVQDCKRQGFTPTWLTTPGALRASFLSKLSADVVGYSPNFPYWADNPAAAQYREVMGKYAKSDAWQAEDGSQVWTSLEMLRQKVLPHPSANPTSEDVLTGLYALHDEDLGGLMANKVTFTQGKLIAPGWPCAWAIEWKNGKPAPTTLSTSDAVCGQQ
jgi:branched-chain amino acid transport system substrate-binding protein